MARSSRTGRTLGALSCNHAFGVTSPPSRRDGLKLFPSTFILIRCSMFSVRCSMFDPPSVAQPCPQGSGTPGTHWHTSHNHLMEGESPLEPAAPGGTTSLPASHAKSQVPNPPTSLCEAFRAGRHSHNPTIVIRQSSPSVARPCPQGQRPHKPSSPLKQHDRNPALRSTSG